MAFGPSLGALLIRLSHQVLSVFYLATALHLLYAVMVWIVFPESLSKEKMAASKARYAAEAGGESGWKRVFGFLSPLGIFFPVSIEAGAGKNIKARKDWNLTLLAIGYASTIMIMVSAETVVRVVVINDMSLQGSYPYKFQYASSMFGWTSETVSCIRDGGSY
jgi:hypothetical protein